MMLSLGLITDDEYRRIMAENTSSFPTFLSAILCIGCYIRHTEQRYSRGGEYMERIIEWDEASWLFRSEVEPLTPEQFQIEYLFIRAELLIRVLLKAGAISLNEYRLIMAENKLSFPTYLSAVI